MDNKRLDSAAESDPLRRLFDNDPVAVGLREASHQLDLLEAKVEQRFDALLRRLDALLSRLPKRKE